MNFRMSHNIALLLVCLHLATTVLAQSPTTAPAPAPAGPLNVTKVLEKAGQFTTLIRLLKITQVGDQINTQLNNSNSGMTLFAPTDNAFSSLSSGTLNSLSDQQKVALIQFHVLPTFVSVSQFQTASNPLRTQAGDATNGQYPLNVTTSGRSSAPAIAAVWAAFSRPISSSSFLQTIKAWCRCNCRTLNGCR